MRGEEPEGGAGGGHWAGVTGAGPVTERGFAPPPEHPSADNTDLVTVFAMLRISNFF